MTLEEMKKELAEFEARHQQGMAYIQSLQEQLNQETIALVELQGVLKYRKGKIAELEQSTPDPQGEGTPQPQHGPNVWRKPL
jgi:uncharacterized protein (DUF3084 family)